MVSLEQICDQQWYKGVILERSKALYEICMNAIDVSPVYGRLMALCMYATDIKWTCDSSTIKSIKDGLQQFCYKFLMIAIVCERKRTKWE